MGDFIKSFWDHVNQRISHPLLGSYTLFWLIYNWKAVFFLLASEKSADRKILEISDTYNISNHQNWWIPLLIALAYVAIMPLISAGIAALHVWPNTLIRKSKAKQDYAYDHEVNNQKRKYLEEQEEILNFERNVQEKTKLNLEQEKEVINLREEVEDARSEAISSTRELNLPPPNTHSNLNPNDVERFTKIYRLENFESNRLIDLIDFLNQEKPPLMSTLPNGRKADIEKFIGLVKMCDKWSYSNKTEGKTNQKPSQTNYIPFEKIKKIGTFREKNNFPTQKEQWDYLLEQAAPEYDETIFPRIMDSWTRNRMGKK